MRIHARQAIALSALVVGVLLAGCAAGPTRPPQFLSGDGPRYPLDARSQGVEGYVKVEYDVSVDGLVEAARVVEAQPEGIFDQAALETVRAWRYKPMVVEGEVQRAEKMQSIIRFEIGEPGHYEDL